MTSERAADVVEDGKGMLGEEGGKGGVSISTTSN